MRVTAPAPRMFFFSFPNFHTAPDTVYYGEIAVGVRNITDPLKPHIFSLSFNAKVMSIVRFDYLLFEVRSYPAFSRHFVVHQSPRVVIHCTLAPHRSYICFGCILGNLAQLKEIWEEQRCRELTVETAGGAVRLRFWFLLRWSSCSCPLYLLLLG